jgi:predicted Zn-dependent protease
MNTAGLVAYSKETSVDLSMTARTKSGKGSGWCWEGGYDMKVVDPERVAKYAMRIAKESDNPEAIEPGRYTVILEPEAVAQLVAPTIGQPTSYVSARAADQGFTVYSRKGGGNKKGLQMADRRCNLITDPYDTIVPYSPLGSDGSITQKMEWLGGGILRNLYYTKTYAKETNNTPTSPPGNGRLYFDGPTKTFEQMVAETQRGLWIHRFAGGGIFNSRTLNMSGVTRDGTFLIENGKITKPVKNLRYMESPFFMLNKVDAWGDPVITQGRFAAPRIKAHDFEFIALSEAV